MPDKHRTLDAARVEQVEHGASVRGKPGSGLRVGAVPGAVSRDDAELSGEPSRHLLPVGARAGLPVQQHEMVRAQLARQVCDPADVVLMPGAGGNPRC